MRLPRNLKIFRGQLDAAPFAGVSFLILLFVVMQSKLVFTPGIPIDLPEVPAGSPGAPNATVIVAIDRSGQIYYESQAVISVADLRARLRNAVQQSREPLILEVQADKAATLEMTAPVLALAGELGMPQALLVTRARTEPIFNASGK
jgi:biopolymer transport protein ExbD